ncbi:hypothetical protein Javan249_0040 [Streptococcus phage Javan249]|uniref:tail assembly chaperone n=1 Tax=Streptococcus halotolerans TaxID=1814128 RepID=UPI000789940D|nr:tail assembly chaperone [Streptococcus halotolerans]QBX16406.1 hypothetical protein Javan249_0040 [Streptococcus phage Javan249]
MEITVKNAVADITFNYGMMFKVDKEMSTINPQTGERNNDGVGALFTKIINRSDDGLVSLIRLALPKSAKKVSEEDIVSAIGNYIEEKMDNDGLDEAEAYRSIFEEVKTEMVDSGFFKEKISTYIQNMEKALRYMEAQEDNEDKALQVAATEEIIGTMKNALS